MKIEKTEYSYQVTECDLKFGEQIILDGELLIPASVLGKIRAEIRKKMRFNSFNEGIVSYDDISKILNKYEQEVKLNNG